MLPACRIRPLAWFPQAGSPERRRGRPRSGYDNRAVSPVPLRRGCRSAPQAPSLRCSNGWLQVVNDTRLSRPRRSLANGPIFIPASAVNAYAEQDLAPLPLRPGEERRVEVDLSRQTLSAWSRVNNTDMLYLQATISSGRAGRRTRPGVYRILRKRWSRYMQGEDEQGPWDLPFIPMVQYCRSNGDAVHGAYWHNNFGQPMSHGCLNMREDQAIRLYRWTLPAHASFQVEEVQGDQRATLIIVKG